MGASTSDSNMKRLVIIDGKSVFYRGYYAMGALSLPDGTPTGGVYGFAAIAMEIVKKLNPTKVVVAWDSKTSVSKRRALYPEYKAGRVKPGEDFYTQIPLLKELIHDLGWDFVELDNYEADDIIGTLSREADEAGDYETFIISSDLDMLQIVDDNTHMWRILKGFSNIEKINVPELEAKYGIKKSQFLDLKALKGDSSDNIPGVPGIGEKTAVKLLNDYGTLDNIYNNIDNISGSTKTKLEAGKDSAYLSKKLAKIMFDAPLNLSALLDFSFDKEKIISGLKKLQFNSLIRKIDDGMEFSRNYGARQPRATRAGDGSGKGKNVLDAHVTRAGDGPGGGPPLNVSEVGEEKVRQDPPRDALLIDWNIKDLMHNNKRVAESILTGKKKFWDLSQAAFLLDPLARDVPQLVVPEEEYQKQLAEFKNYPRLYNIYIDYDLPLIPILYKMEEKGMLIDRDYFKNLQKEFTAEVRRLEQEVYKLAGKEFNLNSPIQLSEILFVDLRLPTKGIKKTSRGYSTGAKELDKLKNLHPIIAKIIEYREAAKLLST